MRNSQSTLSLDGRTGRLTVRAVAALQRAWIGFWRWWIQRVTIRRLQELDDHLLKDIGVDRSEIDSIAHTKGIERMRRYDSITGYMRRPDAPR